MESRGVAGLGPLWGARSPHTPARTPPTTCVPDEAQSGARDQGGSQGQPWPKQEKSLFSSPVPPLSA